MFYAYIIFFILWFIIHKNEYIVYLVLVQYFRFLEKWIINQVLIARNVHLW